MPKNLLSILLFLCFIQSTQAQTKLTLGQCLELLQSQNEDIRQANISILLAEVDVKDAKNAYIPTLSFGAGHSYNLGLAFDQVAGQLITGNKWSNNANANISTRATLFQGFALRNKLKQSLIGLESKEVQKNRLEQSLKLELLAKYFEAAANKSLHETSLKQLEFAQEQLDQEQTKFQLETNTLVDVAQAESQVASSELTGIVNMTSYINSLVALKQLLGIPLTDSVSIENPGLKLATGALLPQGQMSDVGDPTIQLAELSLRQSELNLKYAKGPYYPTVSFSGGYGTNYSSERKDYLTGNYMPFFNQLNQNRNLNFGLSLSVPVFDAFKTKNNINRLKLDLENKQSELNKTKVEREKVLTLAIQEYYKSAKEYQVLQVQHAALEKNYNAMKERYDIGVTTAMEYNKALLDYNVAEANVIKAKYTLMYNGEVIKVLKGER